MNKVACFTLAALLGLAACASATTAKFAPSRPGSPVLAGTTRAPAPAPTVTRDANEVQNVNTGRYYSSVQEAIDDPLTLDGHVLQVTGFHSEGQTVVSKAVTIQGTGFDTGFAMSGNTGTDGDARAWFLVTVPGVTFRDLKFDGGGATVGIALFFHQPGTVDHCLVENIDAPAGSYDGRAIEAYPVHVVVTGCTFSAIGRIGVFLFGSDGTPSTVSGCTYTGKGAVDGLDYGVELGGGAVATVSGNFITRCSGIASVDGSASAGMLVTTYYGAGTAATVTGNRLEGNSTGLAVGYDADDASSVAAHGNGIGSVVNTSSVVMVDASANWWGGQNLAAVTAMVSGSVDFTPWLDANGTAPPDPAFHPDYSGLDVSAASPQSGSAGRIQEAHDLLAGGGFIHLTPGLYVERLNISKPLDLVGATGGSSKRDYSVPPGYAYDTATESVVEPPGDADQAVITIASDGVTIDGVVVANLVNVTSGTYRDLIGLAQSLAAPTGIQITNCVLGPNTNATAQDGNKGRCGITLYGPHTLPVKLAVTHNLIFGSQGNGCGIMLVGPYGPTYHGVSYTSLFAGSQIEDNRISGNHRSGIELAGGVQGGADPADWFFIHNNVIENNGWFALADKSNLKYGNGITMIRGGSDRAYADAAGARYVSVVVNEISGNEKNGIYLGPKCRDIAIPGDYIHDNGAGTGGYGTWDGVRADLDELYYAVGTTNVDYGTFANVQLSGSMIQGNGALGVHVIETPAHGPLDATCNWWNDELGPNASPSNPSSGDGVAGAVTWAPWWSTRGGPCDGYGPNHVAADATGLCLSTATPCVSVPFGFTRADGTPLRGVSVTFTLSSNLVLCSSSSVHTGGLFGGYANRYMEVMDNGSGSYTVDQVLLGSPCGPMTGGELFTLDVARAPGAADGSGTITVTDVVARGCGNTLLAGIPGAAATLPVVFTIPAAATNLTPTTLAPTIGQNTFSTRLAWDNTVPAGDSVIVYRAPYGDYPEYASGSVPATPSYPPGEPWSLAAIAVAPATAVFDTPADRDFWYYVAFVKDPCGNVGAVSNRTSGSLDYLLGDVSDGNVICHGNNWVYTEDISLLGNYYGVRLANPDAVACIDIGPTTDYAATSRPVPDDRVNFEDLMILAVNFNEKKAAPPPPPPPPPGPVDPPSKQAQPIAADHDEVWIDAPARVTAGETFTVALHVRGAGDLHGISTQLDWAESIAKPLTVDASAWLLAEQGVALSGVPGRVDVALLGASQGFTGEGELATVTFVALANGEPQLRIAAMDARDRRNHPATLAAVQPATATVTAFAPAMPNPFDVRTTLGFSLAATGAVSLEVFGIDGRRITTLVNGTRNAGTYRVVWDGRDAGGQFVRPGLYYARLMTPQGRFTRALTLRK